MDSSDEEVFVVSLLCEEAIRKKKKWVHELCSDREMHGEFHTIFETLKRDDRKFHEYFRMSIDKFNELLAILKPEICKNNTTFRRAVGPVERLAVCLRFLATGDSFKTIAFSFHMGHTTVREIVHETCKIICQKLTPKTMPMPDTNAWSRIEERFASQWNFPNCIGAIDGKHVVIEAPANSGSMFFNYKKTFSIVLMALVDADYRFICVDIGSYGKNSDGGIFAASNLGKAIQNGTLNIPEDKILPGTSQVMPHVIVGDEAFPLKRNIMRPYPGSQLNGDVGKRTFNYRLSRARRVSENAFGILSQKFRIYQRRIKLMPENIDNVVLATCCLHNFLREDIFLPSQDSEVHHYEMNSAVIQELGNIGGQSTGIALKTRDHFKDYFVSSAGSVPWQAEMISRGNKRT